MSGILTPFTNDYKVGKGLVFFDRFAAGTLTKQGEDFFGDCKALGVTVKSTEIDHYQSTGGIKILDASVPIQAEASGSLMTENASAANMARFFFGTASTVTQTAATVTDEVVGPVIPGLYYQLGPSALGSQNLNPATPLVLKDSTGVTTYVLGTDYQVDYVSGRIQIIGSTIVAGVTLKATYLTLAITKPKVLSGTTPIEGALRFISNNVAGSQQSIYLPYVKVTPNGTYDLIGDKFTEMSFNLKVMSLAGAPFVQAQGF